MEEMMDAFLIGYVVASVSISLVMSYTLQTIADKNDLSEIARFLTWIPILNCYPMLLVCGASVKQFLLVMVGLIAASVAAGVAASALGGTVGAGVAAFIGIGALLYGMYYFGKLFWVMAERRELSGWLGLLMFVPLVNLAVFAYIAFHDGFSPLNKAGCAVGLVLAIGSGVGNMQLQTLIEQGGSLFEIAKQEAGEGDPEMLTAIEQVAMQETDASAQNAPMQGMAPAAAGQEPESEMEQTKAAIRAMMVMGERFDAIKALDPRDSGQRAQMQALLDSTRMELGSMRHALGEEATSEFLQELDQLQARVASGAPSRAQAANTGAQTAPASMGHGGAGASSMGSCPAGTRRMGSPPPEGNSAWCERNGGVKHGWYATWYDSGVLESRGEYESGGRIGIWSRFFPDGAKRVEAEFANGVQNGGMTVWDASGRVVRETHYEDGQPVSR